MSKKKITMYGSNNCFNPEFYLVKQKFGRVNTEYKGG